MAENITGGYFVYEEKDGDALITNYSGEDTIYIASGAVDGYCFDDEDLILKVGEGSIRLQYMKGRNVTIMTSDSVTTSQVYGTAYTAQDVIKNLVKAWSQTVLTDTAKLDESIKLCSHFDGIQDAIDHMIADCKAAGNANTFLRKYCGIILGNLDTGAITGWDAGGSSVKTAAGVVPETSTVQHITNYTKASFVRDGVTIKIAEKLSSLTADGKKVLDGLYSWWAEEALKLVEESYGVEMAGNKINIALTPSATYRALTSGNDVSINLQGVTFNDTDDYQGNGIDRTIAHEFTHVAQNLFMGYFPQFLMEGLADLTCGIDDKRRSYINTLAGNADSLASYLDLDTAGTGSAFHYAAGYMFYRYLAKQASSRYDSLTAHAWEDNASIRGTRNDDFLTGNAFNQTLSAGAGNDTITTYGDSAQIQGGKGDDTIYNRGDNVTFLYSDGDGADLIEGFNVSGTLRIGDGSGTYSTSKSGSDVIVTVGDGTITLRGAATLKTINIEGKASTHLTLTNSSATKVTLGAAIEVADASARSKPITLVGNALDNSIVGSSSNDQITGGAGNDSISGGKGADKLWGGAGDDILSGNTGNDKLDGGAGDDTLWGGAGNDTLIGGDGADVFLYNGGEGKDIIQGFANDDMLQIIGEWSAAYVAADDAIYFRINSAYRSVTLKDFTATTFNINGATYQIRGSRLRLKG